MVVLFLFVWWARHDHAGADGLFLWLAEVVAFAGGAAASWFAKDLNRQPSNGPVAPASAPPLLTFSDL
jgi:hypothetical protein